MTLFSSVSSSVYDVIGNIQKSPGVWEATVDQLKRTLELRELHTKDPIDLKDWDNRRDRVKFRMNVQVSNPGVLDLIGNMPESY